MSTKKSWKRKDDQGAQSAIFERILEISFVQNVVFCVFCPPLLSIMAVAYRRKHLFPYLLDFLLEFRNSKGVRSAIYQT